MTQPLMTKAICWELAVPVASDFARLHRQYYFFCPESNCLRRVHGARRINDFFRAEDRHADGCPNAKLSTSISAFPQTARIYPRADPPQVVPTWLGPPPQRVNQASPSDKQRKALAEQLAKSAPVVPGSLRDVVTAFHRMSCEQRRDTTLTVDGRPGCYADVFRNVATSSPVALDTVTSPQPIFFCGATVNLNNDFWWIKSLKRFESEGALLPLLLRVPKDAFKAESVQEQIRDVDLYWRGMDPPQRKPSSFLASFFEFEQRGFVALKARLPR